MRYCPNCRRINEAWPERCRFCGLTWNIRICRRGHPNPANAVFCGECGSGDLTDTARGGRFINGIFGVFQSGGPFPLLMLIVKLTIPILMLCVIAQNLEAFLPLLVALAIMIGILRYAVGLLPSWLTGRAGRYFRGQVKDYKDRAKRRDSRGK
jgi:hypothetical protein